MCYPATLTAVPLAQATMPAAHAHGIWFAERSRHLALVHGIGADDLDMAKRLPQVERIIAFDTADRPVAATLRGAGPVVSVDNAPTPVMVGAVLQNGVATATDGTVTLPVRNRGLSGVRGVYAGPGGDTTCYDRIEPTATLSFTLPHAPE